MKRLEEEKKATLRDRMKRISWNAHNRQESQFEDEGDMRVIEDEENAVTEPMDFGECSPEEYINAHMPNREMVEVYEESDGRWYNVPAFEIGVDDNVKTEEEIVAEANNWKVTTDIFAAIMVFIMLVFWLSFVLIS